MGLPAASGTFAGPGRGTGPEEADAEVVVAGCNMAVGSNQLHPVDHTEMASVGRGKPIQL